MRILVVAGEGGSAGGEGRIAQETAIQLAKRGKDVTILYPGYNPGVRSEHGLTCYEYQGDGEYLPIPRQDPRLLHKLQKFLNKKDFDVVHFHNAYGLSLFVQMWAIANKKPTVFTLHSLPSKTADLLPIPKAISKTLGKAFFLNHFTRFVQNSNLVISLSPTMADEISGLDDSVKPIIIPNGRDTTKYKKLRTVANIQKVTHCVYIGNISQYKNQKFLIEVFSKLPSNIILHLIGRPIFEDYAKEVYEKASKLKNVIFEGYLENEETLPILEQAKLFVSASLIENQSIVIIEALASGTPIIALRNSTTDELLDDSVGHVFQQSVTAKQYAQKIIEFSKMAPAKYLDMVTACRKKVDAYSWERVIPQLEKQYINAISNNEDHQARIKPWDKDYLDSIGFTGIKDLGPIVSDISDEVKRTGNKGYLYVAFALTFTGALLAGGYYAVNKLRKKVSKKISDKLEDNS